MITDITRSPALTVRASNPYRISPANSASVTLTALGTAGRLVPNPSSFW